MYMWHNSKISRTFTGTVGPGLAVHVVGVAVAIKVMRSAVTEMPVKQRLTTREKVIGEHHGCKISLMTTCNTPVTTELNWTIIKMYIHVQHKNIL